jgi:hypothetical protein
MKSDRNLVSEMIGMKKTDLVNAAGSESTAISVMDQNLGRQGRSVSATERCTDKTTRNWYSKALEYEYRVKTAVLGTLKRYSILSLTLYLE